MGETVVHMMGPEEFQVQWPHIQRELRTIPHMWELWWTEEAFWHFTMCDRFQCWAAGDEKSIGIICFTQIAEYPAGPILQTVLAFGRNVERYRHALAAALEKFALDKQCTLAEISGREGWGPMLQSMGFKRTHATWTRKLPFSRVN